MGSLRETNPDFNHNFFGRLQLFKRGGADGQTVAKKTLKFENYDDFQTALTRLETRSKLVHPNLVGIWPTNPDPTGLTLDVCFEFIDRSLAASLPTFGEKANLPKLLAQVLAALSHLETAGLYHGDLRPELIFLTADGSSIKLCDSISPWTEFARTQQDNLETGRPLWLTPAARDMVVSDDIRGGLNPFKQDVFALGLILMAAAQQKAQVSQIYETDNPDEAIRELVGNAKSSTRGHKQANEAISFASEHLLAKSPAKRLSPRKAVYQLDEIMNRNPLADSAFLEGTVTPDESDVPYVYQLPDESIPVPMLRHIDASEKTSVTRDYESILPLNKAFPKNEIDFAKTTKVMRPQRRDRAGKLVPRWEVMFVNADMSYKGMGVTQSSIAGGMKDSLGRSILQPIPSLEPMKILRSTPAKVQRNSFKSSFEASYEDPLRKPITASPSPRIVNVQTRTILTEPLPPFDSLKPRVSKVEPFRPKVTSRKNITSALLPISGSFVEATTLGKRQSGQAIARPVQSVNKTYGNILEVSFHKIIPDSNLSTNLGKGIPVGSRPLVHIQTTPTGKQVYRYADKTSA